MRVTPLPPPLRRHVTKLDTAKRLTAEQEQLEEQLRGELQQRKTQVCMCVGGGRGEGRACREGGRVGRGAGWQHTGVGWGRGRGAHTFYPRLGPSLLLQVGPNSR